MSISNFTCNVLFMHMTAFTVGFLLDRIIGDPMNFPHPIRLIGNLISFLEKRLLGDSDKAADRDELREFRRGIILFACVFMATTVVTAIIISLFYIINPFLGMAVEAVLTCYILAAKSLKDESMKVSKALESGTLEDARHAVSMIVGRDTKSLDEKGIIRAAVETVAENTSDGVIAPLIYTFIGGPTLGFIYKAVNTMDSMVGYHSDRYEYFGKMAAMADDAFNFFPARICAGFLIMAAYLGGKDYSGKDAIRIFKRDRFNHKSPNSAQGESVMAGALGVRLAGDAYYFGKLVKKQYIGDAKREIEREDIGRANKLMYLAELLCVLVLLLISILLMRFYAARW